MMPSITVLELQCNLKQKAENKRTRWKAKIFLHEFPSKKVSEKAN